MLLVRETSSIWVTIVPVLVINAILITTLVIFKFSKNRPEKPEYLKGRHESKFLGSLLREWWYWVTNPIAKFLIKMRLKPNSITLIGTFISFIAAVIFGFGLFGYAGWVMVFGATFDMFDGRVARLMKLESRSGAYLDSVMDRFGEGAVFVGLAVAFRDSWLLPIIIMALIGSMLVSYTRAKGEGVGVVCKKGSMQRPERIVYIGVSAILQPVADTILGVWFTAPPPVLIYGAVIIVAVMTNVTAIQRIIAIMNELDTQDRDAEELRSLPQILTSFSTKEGRGKWLDQAKYGYDRSEALKKLCVMILVDGANYKVFNDLVGRGDLPNISRYIIEPGSLTKAVTTFPSTTGPAFTPFVTGCYAGTCNIPGIRWFDRSVPPDKKMTIKRFRDYYGWGSYMLDADLSKDVRTIFEYSKKAINVMGMLNRGAGMTRDPGFFKAPLLFSQAKKSESLEAVERTAFRMFLAALKKNPDFIFYYFPTIDKLSHKNHREHKDVIEAYRRLDDYVGKIADVLKDVGLFDDTSLVLTSDHGHSDVREHFDLDNFFETRCKTLYVPSKFKEWMSAEAINLVSGNSMSNVYLKDKSWEKFSFIEGLKKKSVVNSLIEKNAVDVVLGRSEDGGVSVVSERGSARISEDQDGKIHYRAGDKDPFGYSELPEYMSPEEALSKTWETNYPDGIMQALQIFRSPRCGDLVLSASEGFDLRERFEDPPHSSTHGSLHAEHMFVPFCINQPISADKCRTADIFPTVTKILGIEPTHDMDGHSLI